MAQEVAPLSEREVAELERRVSAYDDHDEGQDIEHGHGIYWSDLRRLLATIRSRDAQLREMRAALEEIAHAPEYDGSLCEDPGDCPNCIARKALTAPHSDGLETEKQ